MVNFLDGDFELFWSEFVAKHLNSGGVSLSDGDNIDQPIMAEEVEIDGDVVLSDNGVLRLQDSSGLIIANKISFLPGSTIRSSTQLRLFAREIDGPILDLDLSGRNGDEGPLGATGSSGGSGSNGPAGRNGKNAKWNHSSSAGSPGGHGSVGNSGGRGGNGGTGVPGNDGKSIELYAERYGSFTGVNINARGGNGGVGGNGGLGGNGGNGGNGGQGGKGGNAKLLNDASRGGNGGNGARGGDGGIGGDGGHGGGVVIVKPKKIIGEGGAIRAGGEDSETAAYDGAGGAGAGGSVWLSTLRHDGSEILLDATGGTGGNTANDVEQQHVGAGGGGGGGRIWLSDVTLERRSGAYRTGFAILLKGGSGGRTIRGTNDGTTDGGHGFASKTFPIPIGTATCDERDDDDDDFIDTRIEQGESIESMEID